MTELVFYTNPQSRGRIVRRMLQECGVPYETRVVEYGPQMKSAPYTDINPMGKVPAIACKGKVVTECAAIIAWLAETFPQAELAPVEEERADYYRWLFFAAGPLESAIINRALGVEIHADKQSFVGYGSFDLAVRTISDAVDRYPWITGERFTAADVYVGSQIGYGLMFGTLPENEALRNYWERVSTRPAWQQAEEMDNALMPKQP